MLKQITIAAFALTAVSAFAQDSMMVPDAKSSKPNELFSFIQKDAYKKLGAPDAYILTSFLAGLPGNFETAVLRGLAGNAQEASTIRMENQTAANAMAPMGDTMPPMESSFSNFQHGDRSFKTVTMDPAARLSYYDTIQILQGGQDETDKNLILTLFHPRSFVESQLMDWTNERALDAITRYIKANAASTKAARLKYTSLAPHMYTSPTIPR